MDCHFVQSEFLFILKHAKMFQDILSFFFCDPDITESNRRMRMVQNLLQHGNILRGFIKPIAKCFSERMITNMLYSGKISRLFQLAISLCRCNRPVSFPGWKEPLTV